MCIWRRRPAVDFHMRENKRMNIYFKINSSAHNFSLLMRSPPFFARVFCTGLMRARDIKQKQKNV